MKVNFARKLVWISLLIVFGCKPTIESGNYASRCKNLNNECQLGCFNTPFNTCYVDTKLFPNGPYDMVQNCYATHVGESCAPCEHKFSLSFGGALRSVTCQEFLKSLDKKNQECGNCLQKYGESIFSF